MVALLCHTFVAIKLASDARPYRSQTEVSHLNISRIQSMCHQLPEEPWVLYIVVPTVSQVLCCRIWASKRFTTQQVPRNFKSSIWLPGCKSSLYSIVKQRTDLLVVLVCVRVIVICPVYIYQFRVSLKASSIVLSQGTMR